MQKILFLCAFLGVFCRISAQFERFYGDETSKNEGFLSSVMKSNGNVCQLGYTHNNSVGGSDFYLVETSLQGQIVWQKQWSYMDSDMPVKLLLHSNGNLFLIGRGYDNPNLTGYGYYAMLDPTGQVLWQSTLSSQLDITWSDAIIASTGDIYLVGNKKNGNQNDMQFWKLDANGNVAFNQNIAQVNGYSLVEKSATEIWVGVNDATNWDYIQSYSNTGTAGAINPLSIAPYYILLQNNEAYISDQSGNIEKYDNTFVSLWSNSFNGYKLLGLTNDGNILAGGRNILTKINAVDGSIVWESVPTNVTKYCEYQSVIFLNTAEWAASGASGENGGSDGLLEMINPQDGSSMNHYIFGTQGLEATEYGNALSSTPDGGFILAGDNVLKYVGTPETVPRIVKTDNQGNQQWITDLGVPTTNYSTWSTCNANGGGYMVMGYYSDSTSGIFAAKLDAQGVPQWTKYYPTGINFIFGKIQAYPSGGYAIVGTVKPATGLYNTGVVRINDSGDTLWTRKYPLAKNYNNPYDFIITNTGSLVIAARARVCDINGANCKSKQTLLKIDPNGNLLWDKSYHYVNQQTARFSSVVENATNGDLYAYGFVSEIDANGYLVEHGRLIHTNMQGDSLGQYTVLATANSTVRGYRVCLSPNQEPTLFSLVEYDNDLTNRKINIRKLSPSFSTIWDKYYGHHEGVLMYGAEALSDGSFAVMGSSSSVNNYDFYLLKTDGNGNVAIHTNEKLPFEANIFPNPSSGNAINVKLKGEITGKYILKLYNSQGQILWNQSIITDFYKIDTEKLTKGTYFLQITDESGKSLTKSISIM